MLSIDEISRFVLLYSTLGGNTIGTNSDKHLRQVIFDFDPIFVFKFKFGA